MSIAASPSASVIPTGANLVANAYGGTAPYTYAWSGSGITFSNAAIANPVATVASASTFTATVVVTDFESNTVTASVEFTTLQIATSVEVFDQFGNQITNTPSPGLCTCSVVAYEADCVTLSIGETINYQINQLETGTFAAKIMGDIQSVVTNGAGVAQFNVPQGSVISVWQGQGGAANTFTVPLQSECVIPSFLGLN